MLTLHAISLKDKPWVDEIVMAENCPSADFNFGNIFIWDGEYRQSVCRLGSRMITLIGNCDPPVFAFPVGCGDLHPAVDAMREYAEVHGFPLEILGITDAHRALLEKEYPGCFAFFPDETFGDYIYSAERLASYSGKGLHAKKNHCNRFEAENSWDFVPLTPALVPDCRKMLEQWTVDNAARLDESIHYEHDALLLAFDLWNELGLDGGVLRIDGRVAGFTVGEMCSPDTFNVHFEKADTGINGAYPMVCREFVRMLRMKYPALLWINREDDMGLESLRRSKLSYRPEYLLRKYRGRWENG